MKGCKKMFNAHGNAKKAWGATFTLHKMDFKTKIVTRDIKEHYIMIKRSIQQENIILVNIYASNICTQKYIQQILTNIKGDIGSNTVMENKKIIRDTMINFTPIN